MGHCVSQEFIPAGYKNGSLRVTRVDQESIGTEHISRDHAAGKFFFSSLFFFFLKLYFIGLFSCLFIFFLLPVLYDKPSVIVWSYRVKKLKIKNQYKTHWSQLKYLTVTI